MTQERKKAHLREEDSGGLEAAIGREADRPSGIPTDGWKDILRRVVAQVRDDRIQIVAAALAFFALLAAFPTLIAIVSIYGLVSDPAAVQDQIGDIAALLPPEASALVASQLTSIVETSTRALGWTAAAAIVGALWSASSGMQQLIKAINIAYDEEETRGFWKVRGLALLMTIGLVVFLTLSLGLIVAVPPLLGGADFGRPVQWAIQIGSFLLLAGVFMVFLALLYRYAPDRQEPNWRWVSWGAVIATILWVIASILFTVFVTQFGTFQQTYGALAGVIILMLWFFITGLVVTLGAELNSEIEHQTARDSTTGPARPIGERGAVKADTVGDSRR